MNHARMFRALALFPEARPPQGPAAPVPLHLLGWQGASPSELQRLTRARSAIELSWPEEGCPREARKRSLRLAEDRLGPTGLAVLDLGARRIWSREALGLELEHEADLDVIQLFHAHVVAGAAGDGRRWLHTHGLDELGGLDFEVLDPGEGLLEAGEEFLRRMGEAVLGGEVDESTRMFWLGGDAGWVQLVPVDEFQAAAREDLRRLRTPGVPGHDGPWRRVLCEADSFRLRPAEALRDGWGIAFEVSPEAQVRRDERGRDTTGQARRILEELGEMVRGRWFEVSTGGVYRWLDVVSWDWSGVAGSELGDGIQRRGDWEEVVDWVLVTDVGEIRPHDTVAARRLRDVLEELETGPPIH